MASSMYGVSARFTRKPGELLTGAGRRAIYDALDAAGVWFTWHEFNAAHAFLRDEGERYDPACARLAIGLAADLFGRCL